MLIDNLVEIDAKGFLSAKSISLGHVTHWREIQVKDINSLVLTRGKINYYVVFDIINSEIRVYIKYKSHNKYSYLCSFGEGDIEDDIYTAIQLRTKR